VDKQNKSGDLTLASWPNLSIDLNPLSWAMNHTHSMY